MKNSNIDLHVHSSYSDGTFSPEDLVKKAIEKQLSAIAITDHDTTSGISPAMEAALHTNLEIIPGVELSTDYNNKEIHIIGLFIQADNIDLLEATKQYRQTKDNRNRKIIEKLQNEGFHITMDEVIKENPDAVIGRANIARFLVEHKQIDSINKAFTKYLGDNCKCYVPRYKISPAEACDLICKANGLPILAHPILYRMNNVCLNRLIQELKSHGLVGIEAVYSTYTKGDELRIRKIAEENHLLLSGGSDFHGTNKPYIDLGTGKGNLCVPYAFLEQLKSKL